MKTLVKLVLVLGLVAITALPAGCSWSPSADGAIKHLRRDIGDPADVFEGGKNIVMEIEPLDHDAALDYAEQDPSITTVEDIERMDEADGIEAIYYLLVTVSAEADSGYYDESFLYMVWVREGESDYVCGICLSR